MSKFRISISSLESLSISILCNHKTSFENAFYVARGLISAEIDGKSSHGLLRLPYYVSQSACGKVDGFASPEIVSQKHGSFRIDAKRGFSFPASSFALPYISCAARNYGISCVSIFNSHHLGQVGYHVEQLSLYGLIGIILSNTPAAIAPWGGKKAILGTNPLAFSCPSSSGVPLLIDLSMSRVARGRILVAAQNNEPLGSNWALDSDGKPTLDAKAALSGSLLPFGSWKGSNLAVMIEILSAALSGSNFSYESSSFLDNLGPSPNIGHLMIAIDPDFFSKNSFLSRMDTFLSVMLEEEGVRLPGSLREKRRKEAEQHGIELDEGLYEKLLRLSKGPDSDN